ncbi:thioredoxin [Virgisporangium ochraceum]|jgi:thioredoxin 1|uniref:Thioredoxin n=1 Tax=Virgisporangium ochraceum TaxID=65505 RepID=A0A8J3ZNA8_9ACTN|nr:thioredoxin [Virgisporangium ochraceum]GIJ67444.1 thioredoxin [Virgisporangium ochraceum]
MSTVVTVTDATFQEVVLGNDKPVVVDFWAEWCKPCVMISKSLGELAEEYGDKLVIAKIDADTNPEAVRTYGVMSMPTLLMFRQGEVVGTSIGAKPKASLRKAIDELI